MIRAIRLITGDDMTTYLEEGEIDETSMSEVQSLSFKETPAHSSLDWHTAPHIQYVITLSGTLEFTTDNGKCVIRPGDVLIAKDILGHGHQWRLIDNEPWKRAYIVLKSGAKDLFISKRKD
jgi:quercetin dioxygenase-like cupin family protein